MSSIWSPLTRRRWWNHIGDDTALCGITSAMIRRQPDHLNCPSPYPFPLSSLPPSNPIPSRGCEANGVMCGRQASPAASLCCSASKQPRQGRQERACGGLVYRSRGPWCYETPVQTHQQKPVHRRWRVETLCSEHELRMRRREHDPEHLICGRRRRESSSSSIEGHLKHRYVRVKCH